MADRKRSGDRRYAGEQKRTDAADAGHRTGSAGKPKSAQTGRQRTKNASSGQRRHAAASARQTGSNAGSTARKSKAGNASRKSSYTGHKDSYAGRKSSYTQRKSSHVSRESSLAGRRSSHAGSGSRLAGRSTGGRRQPMSGFYIDGRTKGIIYVLLCFIALSVILQLILRPDRKAQIDIVYTANVQGHVEYVQGEYPGYEKIAACAANAAASGCDRVVTVDAGSCLGGGADVEIDSGASGVSLMNAAGYEFLTPGSGEFVYDTDQLSTLESSASFGFYAANVTKSDGSAVFQNDTIIETGGVHLLLTGVTDAISDKEADSKGLTVNDPVQTVRNVIEQDGSKCDAVVVIANLADASALKDIASDENVSLVINGGSAELSDEDKSDKVISAADISSVGVVSMNIDRHGAQFSNQAYTVDDLADMQADSAVTSQINTVINAIDSARSESLGEIEVASDNEPEGVTLTGEETDEEESDEDSSDEDSSESDSSESDTGSTSSKKVLHNYETGTGDLVTDSMLSYASGDGAQVALIKDSEILSTLESGDVTRGDVFDLFDNGLCMVSYKMTGGQLSQILEDSYDGYSEAKNFLQAAGISYTYTNDTALGSRITDLMIGDEELDDASTYTVVTTSQTAEDLGFADEVGLKQEKAYCSMGTIVSQMIQSFDCSSEDDGSRINLN